MEGIMILSSGWLIMLGQSVFLLMSTRVTRVGHRLFLAMPYTFRGIVFGVMYLSINVHAQTPNIIFLLADDMGWGDSSVYNLDSKIQMPALEQLAAQGIRFTDAHTTPKCAPTRYSVMTGNYHWRGLWSWGQWNYRGGSQVLDGQMTLGSILKEAGYETAIFGKLHLGGDFYEKGSDNFVLGNSPEELIDFGRRFRNGPLDYGFNYSYLALRGIQKSPYAFFENDILVGNPSELSVWSEGQYGSSRIIDDGIGMPYWDSSQVGPILTRKAIDFIDRHHQQNLVNGTDKPFFLYYASQAAHDPSTPPYTLLRDPVKGVTGMGNRADMIYELDVTLAKLIEALDQHGLTDNTLIIFTSDNGSTGWSRREMDLFGHDPMGGLKGNKGLIWEGGHRVPFVAKWGDGTSAGSVIPPGSVSNRLIAVQDFIATVAALTGHNCPVDQARDSISFLPALLGQDSSTTPGRTHLVMEAREREKVGENGNVHTDPHFSLREGPWKLILDENDNVSGLYNLAEDLGETSNLMHEPTYINRINRMRAILFQHRNSIRTAPVTVGIGPSSPSVKGKPLHQPGEPAAVDLWKETFDGPFHLQVNGGGPLSEFHLTLLAENPFEVVVPHQLESNDTLLWSGNHVSLSSRVTTWKDGIDFIAPYGSRILIKVEQDGQQELGKLYTGSSGKRLVSSAWLINTEVLPPLPSFVGGEVLGLFLGRDPSSGALATRWNGDGNAHRTRLGLVFSKPIINLVPVGFESNDTLVSTDFTAHVDSILRNWWDGLDAIVAPDTLVGLTYLQDGLIQPTLVNPTTGGYGLPNAYQLPAPDALGKPTYEASREEGLFIWKDYSGIWHIRVTAGGGFGHFAGAITASAPYSTITEFLLESHDVLNLDNPERIEFDFRVWNHCEDGIDFTVPEGAEIQLELNENTREATNLVTIGKERWPISRLPLVLSR